MNIIITEDYDELSEKASEIIIEHVRNKPDAVLGLATGSTPLGLYKRLVEDHKENGTSYKQIRAVNLDEYKGLTKDHPQSYAWFMRKNLFDRIDIDLNNTYIETGTAKDEKSECERYDSILEQFPRDIQLLGLGSNGHIAFNEPNTPFDSTTHVVTLADSTVKDNARLFSDISEVPRKAYTMGLKSIMQAKKILLLASGLNKADAVAKLMYGKPTEELPASIISEHKDCTVILDEKAASKL